MFATTFHTLLVTLVIFALGSLLSVTAAPISPAGSLVKRQSFNGRATFYDVGLGACGQYNVESDYIVALNTPQYGGGYPGPNCGRSITISYGGKTAQATIMDQCPSCGFGDLDLSRSLFNHFSDPGAGVFQMSWSFNDGNSGQQQEEKPKPSPTHAPTPTSTWTPPPSTRAPEPTPTPTSTWSPEPTPESSSSSATITSTSEASSSASADNSTIVSLNATISGSVISIPIPSDVASAAGLGFNMGNLALLNQFVTNLGAVIVIGAGAESQNLSMTGTNVTVPVPLSMGGNASETSSSIA